MKTAVKSPESAVYRRGLEIFLIETPPLTHRDTSSVPSCPPSGSTQWLFQGPTAESKFLTTSPALFFLAGAGTEAHAFDRPSLHRKRAGTIGISNDQFRSEKTTEVCLVRKKLIGISYIWLSCKGKKKG
jgi:hypothetical protein